MPYDVKDIKVLAYNRDYKDDFTLSERFLYLGLAYAYDWFRYNPQDKQVCEELVAQYIETYYNDKALEEQIGKKEGK